MFLKKMLVSSVGVFVAVVPLFGSGGKTAVTSELKLRIPGETAPAGATVQMKVLTTEATPISGGRPGFAMDSMFDAAAGFSIAAPDGEVAGAAIVDGPHVQIFYTGTSLLSASYPIVTVVLGIRADAAPGNKALFTLDQSSVWNYSTTGPVAAKISPATVTVAGEAGIAVSDVVPGEGVWPAGTIVSVRGVGFTSGKTALRVNAAGVKTFTVVSPSEIQFALTQATEMRGLRITVQGSINSSTYYVHARDHRGGERADAAGDDRADFHCVATHHRDLWPHASVRRGPVRRAGGSESDIRYGDSERCAVRGRRHVAAPDVASTRRPQSPCARSLGVARRHCSAGWHDGRRHSVVADRRDWSPVRRRRLDDNPDAAAAAQALIGFIDDAPADMAEHHDDYRYGRPRG